MKHFGSPSGLKCIANEPHSFSRLKVFFIRGKIFKKYCSFQRPSDVLWKMCLTLWKFLSATSCSFQCNAASNPSSCIEHGRRKFFSAGSNSGYSSGAKSGEISMYPLATKKTSVFAKNLMRKCQILKSREARSLLPFQHSCYRTNYVGNPSSLQPNDAENIETDIFALPEYDISAALLLQTFWYCLSPQVPHLTPFCSLAVMTSRAK